MMRVIGIMVVSTILSAILFLFINAVTMRDMNQMIKQQNQELNEIMKGW